MIKVKLLESDIHRNETSFRYYQFNNNLFKKVGIEFTDSDSYDYVMVGQASIIDKKLSLEESVNKGLEFLSKITGDYIIFDGQDSTTLIGTFDIFAKLLMVNRLHMGFSVSGVFRLFLFTIPFPIKIVNIVDDTSPIKYIKPFMSAFIIENIKK